MLYVYDKRKKALSPCKETEFRSHGLLERQDLGKWIEQNPAILGEELLIVTSEYDKFDKTNERLDFLGIDKDGNLVVIELKRDDSGKNVDLQALKYAAYCSTLRLTEIVEMFAKYKMQKGNADFNLETSQKEILDFIENDDFEEFNDRPRIMLVAKEFRPEVTASVLWLRKFDLDISCIKWAPYELSDDIVAVNSSILIPLPEAKDFIIRAEKKEIAEHTKSLTQTEYAQFYTQCVDLLKKKLPREYVSPSTKNYYQIGTGISGVHYEWAFHGRPRSSFGVELHFEKSSKDINQDILKVFEQLKTRLEAELNETIIFQSDWGKVWSRLYFEKQEGRFTEELISWAVDKMFALIQVVQPILDKTKKS